MGVGGDAGMAMQPHDSSHSPPSETLPTRTIDTLSNIESSPPVKMDYPSPLPMPLSSTTPSETVATPPPVAATKRKASTSISSRGVANLTPEQLARKRANDRQAQRAIRERTRAQIEILERKVRELSSQQPYQDLQKAVVEKEAIQAENEEIKRRLTAVLDIIQPLVRKSENNAVAVSAVHPEVTHPSPVTDRNRDTPISIKSASVEPSGTESTIEASSPTQSTARSCARADPFSFVSNAISQRLSLNDFGEKLILNFLVENCHQIPKINDIRRITESALNAGSPGGQSHDIEPASVDQPLAYMVPIRNVPPTCPLDVIFLDFLHHRRCESTEGVQQRLAYPSVSSLLNPSDKNAYSYTISKVFTDILRTFPDLSALPEQAGVMYLMFLLMRWQIYPTQQNYDLMPDWMTPRPAQLLTQHPAWIDYVLWPKMRDRMVPMHQNYPFENWFIPYTQTMSCNWPYEAADCLLHNTESDELLINPVFERHVRDLNNWSLGTSFVEAFPGLADATKIKSDKRPWPPSS